jgi:hypothetical protein
MAEVPSVGATLGAMDGFWARQFAERVTWHQRVFDVVFGILAPAGCLLGDPIVFTSGGLLQDLRVCAYAIVALSFIILALWLALGPRLGFAVAVLAGGLFAGAVFAAGVGVLLSPLSLVTLVVAIGALGLTPFLTAFVFLRNGVRALRVARRTGRPATVIVCAMLGAVAVLGAPGVLQDHAARVSAKAIARIVDGSPQEMQDAIETLAAWRPLVDSDRLVRAYQREADPEHQERLTRAYQALTGASIAKRLWEMND